ncbi:MAG TPA: two-component regulator propeller domain-containing protein, partial [Saprospiraceae bacterium]|nr:two-component regulator propeller domain-containing protein [Saprospiraceae bacterium]
MNRFLFVVTFCFLLGNIRAQEPLFQNRDIGDANVGIAINKMIQDHQSMIWLGMEKHGLSRYDGYEWHHVILDSTSLNLEVTSLFEDRIGKIWVGTAQGKIFYLDLARKVHLFDIEEGNPAKPITSILQDLNGQIWFATYGEGVYVYTGARLFNLGIDDGLSGNDIYTMTSTPSGEIWLGTDDGINVCTFKDEQKQIKQLGLKEGLPDQIVTSLRADLKGNVWIGTFENGIVYYDAALKKINTPFISTDMDEVTSIEIFDDTELWIGTRNSGLWRYHPDTKFVRRLVQFNELQAGEISDLMSDVEGNIWVSTNEGILLSAFRPFESLILNVGEVQTIFCDYKDQVWI